MYIKLDYKLSIQTLAYVMSCAKSAMHTELAYPNEFSMLVVNASYEYTPQEWWKDFISYLTDYFSAEEIDDILDNGIMDLSEGLSNHIPDWEDLLRMVTRNTQTKGK